MSKKKPPPCTCGSKDKCTPRAPKDRTRPMPTGPDVADHWRRLISEDLCRALYGTDTAFRLRSNAWLWERDGPGSPWHDEYWQTWARRALNGVDDVQERGSGEEADDAEHRAGGSGWPEAA